MQIINPTEDAIEIMFKGEKFSVEGKGSVEVSADVAEFWLKIHQFMEVADSAPKAAKKTVKKEEKKEEDNK